MKSIKYLFAFMLALGMVLPNISMANSLHEKSTNHVRAERVDASKKDEATININSADAKALTSLKGIGKKRAEAIIEYRKDHGPFKSIDDLANVKGIGNGRLAKIKENNSNRIIVD